MALLDKFKKKELNNDNGMYLYSDSELEGYQEYIRRDFGVFT